MVLHPATSFWDFVNIEIVAIVTSSCNIVCFWFTHSWPHTFLGRCHEYLPYCLIPLQVKYPLKHFEQQRTCSVNNQHLNASPSSNGCHLYFFFYPSEMYRLFVISRSISSLVYAWQAPVESFFISRSFILN